MHLNRAFCFLFVLCAISIQQAHTQEWEKALEKDGITVFTRDVPGKAYKAFKATTTVNASLHSLLALFKSVEKMPDWLTQCEQTKLIRSDNFWHQLSYHEVQVPLFRNRDMVMEMRISKDTLANTLRIDMKGRPDLYPEQAKKIRVKEVEGYWICKPLANGLMQIEYCMYLDPEGIIPSWLYNKRLKNDPYQTLLNLSRTVQSQSFKSAFYLEVAQLTKQ